MTRKPEAETGGGEAGAVDPAELTALIPDLERAARAISRRGGEAEDLAQEALLRVWARLASGAAVEDLRPYLLTTLRNLARRPPRLPPAEAAPPEATPPEAAGRIAVREVAEALRSLPAEQARLLVAAAAGTRTLAELAEETGVPPGTVASRVARARARLRAAVDLPEHAPVSALLDP
ncbi:MAG: sigma-70 family RNA polymerase sigma factor [Rhodobacteraceae bacterium]|nr:sigma-70 family RNA polymerase sigma factor [Paracoccaceae bacterium]